MKDSRQLTDKILAHILHVLPETFTTTELQTAAKKFWDGGYTQVRWWLIDRPTSRPLTRRHGTEPRPRGRPMLIFEKTAEAKKLEEQWL